MSDLETLRIGDRVAKFPARTWNRLVAGELRDRAALLTIDDTRRPKTKSTVVVQLVWDGGAQVEPGRVVKLGDAVFDPAVDEWAPFAGLIFHAAEFAADDDANTPHAITLEPIAGGGSSVGFGVMPNASWAKLNVTNAAHTHAQQPLAGTLLVSGTSGLRILWKQAGTGEKWAVVQITGGGDQENYRAIRGHVIGPVLTTDAAFLIRNIVPLAGGLDPSSGDPFAAVVVVNLYGQSFADNESATALYSPGVSTLPAANWEPLKKGGGGSSGEKVIVIIRTAIAPATRIAAGPVWVPSVTSVERAIRNASGHWGPSGETVDVENSLPDSLPAPATSNDCYIGKATPLADGTLDLDIESCNTFKTIGA